MASSQRAFALALALGATSVGGAAGCRWGEEIPYRFDGGRAFDARRVGVVQRHVTTQEQVTQLFGEPLERNPLEGGGERWVYWQEHVRDVVASGRIVPERVRDVRRDTLTVDVDAKGVVAEVKLETTQFTRAQ